MMKSNLDYVELNQRAYDSPMKQQELIYQKLSYKLLQYVSYKLISVLKAADDGCFDIFAGKLEATVAASPVIKSPAKVMKPGDEKPKDRVEDAAESQRIKKDNNLKMAQHKQWLESVKQLFKTMMGMEKTMTSQHLQFSKAVYPLMKYLKGSYNFRTGAAIRQMQNDASSSQLRSHSQNADHHADGHSEISDIGNRLGNMSFLDQSSMNSVFESINVEKINTGVGAKKALFSFEEQENEEDSEMERQGRSLEPANTQTTPKKIEEKEDQLILASSKPQSDVDAAQQDVPAAKEKHMRTASEASKTATFTDRSKVNHVVSPSRQLESVGPTPTDINVRAVITNGSDASPCIISSTAAGNQKTQVGDAKPQQQINITIQLNQDNIINNNTTNTTTQIIHRSSPREKDDENKADSRKQTRPSKRPDQKTKARSNARQPASPVVEGRAELTQWAAGEKPESDIHRSATSLPDAGRRSSGGAAAAKMSDIRDSGAQPVEQANTKQNGGAGAGMASSIEQKEQNHSEHQARTHNTLTQRGNSNIGLKVMKEASRIKNNYSGLASKPRSKETPSSVTGAAFRSKAGDGSKYFNVSKITAQTVLGDQSPKSGPAPQAQAVSEQPREHPYSKGHRAQTQQSEKATQRITSKQISNAGGQRSPKSESLKKLEKRRANTNIHSNKFKTLEPPKQNAEIADRQKEAGKFIYQPTSSANNQVSLQDVGADAGAHQLSTQANCISRAQNERQQNIQQNTTLTFAPQESEGSVRRISEQGDPVNQYLRASTAGHYGQGAQNPRRVPQRSETALASTHMHAQYSFYPPEVRTRHLNTNTHYASQLQPSEGFEIQEGARPYSVERTGKQTRQAAARNALRPNPKSLGQTAQELPLNADIGEHQPYLAIDATASAQESILARQNGSQMHFYKSARRPAGQAAASSAAASAMVNIPQINDGSKLNLAYQNSFKVSREPSRPRSIAGGGRQVAQLTTNQIQDKIQTFQLKRQGQNARGSLLSSHSHSHAQVPRSGARSQQTTIKQRTQQVYRVAPVRDWDQAKFQLTRGQKDPQAERQQQYDRFIDGSLQRVEAIPYQQQISTLQHSQLADPSLLDNSEINNQLDHIEDTHNYNLKQPNTPSQANRDTAILFTSKPVQTAIHPLLPAVDDFASVDNNRSAKKTGALAQAALHHQSSFGSLSQISYHTLNQPHDNFAGKQRSVQSGFQFKKPRQQKAGYDQMINDLMSIKDEYSNI